MEYEQVERDFVKRSLEIIRQYDKHVLPSVSKNKQFEVTLLINSLLGLIVLPFEHCKRSQNNVRFPQVCECDNIAISRLDSNWGLDKLRISTFTLDGKKINPDEASLRQIVAMFRHSFAHAQFGDGTRGITPEGISVSYNTSPQNPSESVILEVNIVNRHRDTEFVAVIPVKSLKQFASRFATAFLDGSIHLENTT